jgi:tetratricopeptide (TPR) repeat protein
MIAALHAAPLVADADEELAAALLGEGLPPEAEAKLKAAGASYHDDAAAERLLIEAHSLAPNHPAVLIAAYRYHFYKGRLAEALAIARACLTRAAQELGIDPDWRRAGRGDAAFGLYDAVLPRFFLFSLKGYAYLSMRLGDLAAGRAAVTKLLDLDPTDKVGARVLLSVLERAGREDEDLLDLWEAVA